jgi:hypothetical protein
MIDPVFAAIAAAREAHARFERALRTENFTVDVSLREAMRELAATVPTTVAGVAAITGFVREMTRELGDSFFQDRDAVAYAESLDTAVRRLTGLKPGDLAADRLHELGAKDQAVAAALLARGMDNTAQSAAADLQCQSHLRIDVACIGAQRRERHAEETNSFAHRKLRRE